MRRTIRETKENLEEFVFQDEYHMLLVGSADPDVAYFLKIEEQLQGEDGGSLYFSFVDDFIDQNSYAFAIAERLNEMLLADNEVRIREGRDALVPFPDTMLAPATEPRRRLLIAVEHMSQWLADPEENRLVITLMPLNMPPGDGYHRFLGLFARYDAPAEPWMQYTRLIGRDDRTTYQAAVAFENAGAWLMAFSIDFSIEALAADMAADTVDPSVPMAERMQAHLQLAAIDLSYQRHEEASRKYAVLYEYYRRSETPLMQALCLLGDGDCMRMAGQTELAQTRYQQGLALVIETPSPHPVPAPPLEDGSPNPNPGMHPSAPPIMLNLLLAAGDSSMKLEQYDEARGYFEGASKVAAKCMNPYAAADALERQGDAEYVLARFKEALETWRSAEAVAETCDYYLRLESVLTSMARLQRTASLLDEAKQTEDKIAEVRLKKEQAAA